ncbi:unnamed protein product [Camellia sinensis]
MESYRGIGIGSEVGSTNIVFVLRDGEGIDSEFRIKMGLPKEIRMGFQDLGSHMAREREGN